MPKPLLDFMGYAFYFWSNENREIYGAEDCRLLYRLEPEGLAPDWVIELSQISGMAEEGWIVFSNGDSTYRITYPDGHMEKIGEYMYAATYSPDGKYLAYCTGNSEMDFLGYLIQDDTDVYEKWLAMYGIWRKIPCGWYVVELETGNRTYIARLLNGNR